MDYSKFSIKDFLADDYFLRWVNQGDPEAEKFWTLFISLHPETKSTIDQARAFALNLKQADSLAFEESELDQMWKGIQGRIAEDKGDAVKMKRHFVWSYSIAASLIFLASFTGVYYFLDRKEISTAPEVAHYTPPPTDDFLEEINTTENTIKVHLSDGSIVNLEKNSRLKYKKSYEGDESRHVFLTGEAFFDVSKNPQKPFFVHADEVVTKVLGTSFRIKAYGDEKNIIVAVKSGKVSVFSPKSTNKSASDIHSEVNGVILLPNEQVVYQREQELFDKTLVGSPAILSGDTELSDFTFESTPIADVFHVLEEAYGIEIIFDEEVMEACFITAPLGSEPLFEKLKIICRTIGANYEIMDTKVVINSSGC